MDYPTLVLIIDSATKFVHLVAEVLLLDCLF